MQKRVPNKATQAEADAINEENYKQRILRRLAKGETISGFGFNHFIDDPRFEPYKERHLEVMEEYAKEIDKQIEKLSRIRDGH